jgi:transcriptional regulator with XRE-family HTH domain
MKKITKEIFRARRLKLKLTQLELSVYFDVQSQQISNIERGICPVPDNADWIFKKLKGVKK